jgi:hypothetical protein
MVIGTDGTDTKNPPSVNEDEPGREIGLICYGTPANDNSNKSVFLIPL